MTIDRAPVQPPVTTCPPVKLDDDRFTLHQALRFAVNLATASRQPCAVLDRPSESGHRTLLAVVYP